MDEEDRRTNLALIVLTLLIIGSFILDGCGLRISIVSKPKEIQERK